MAHERLSAQDASFLAMETRTTPMHVGSVTLFQAAPFTDEAGRFRLDDVRRLIESRLPLVPRYRQRLMGAPLGSGRPVWVDDHRFDLPYHVRLTALPRPGREDQLEALAGRLLAAALDRHRPLWEFWFIEGVEGDRVALLHKTHHALVDGDVALDVATVLFDGEPLPPPAPEDVVPWDPVPAPSSAGLLAETLVSRAGDPVRAALRGPGAAVEDARQVGRAIVAGSSTPRLPFNEPVGPTRRFCMARLDLEEAKVVKRAAGCTVNDVVLAVVASGLRRWLQHAGVPVDGMVAKALNPVSVSDGAGSRVQGFLADMAVGEPDPAARLAAVSRSTRDLKASGGALAVDRIATVLGYAPPTLLGLAGRLLPLQRAANLVVTNVPGPRAAVYCMGARMLEPFPYIGLVDNLGLAVAVVSYDGKLLVGITADPDLVPDVEVMAEGIEKGATELAEVVR